MNNVIAIIPALNPDEILCEIVLKLKQRGFEKIIVVNDGSFDNTVFYKIKDVEGVDILNHAVNLGKGRALKTAFNHVLNNYRNFHGVITIDADGQHDLVDILKCTEALEDCYLDDVIILGCRQFKKDNNIPLRSKLGNICTQYVLRYLCSIYISDTQTGLRGIPVHMLADLMKVAGESYEYETNMLLEVNDAGGTLIKVPIKAIYENGNKTSHFNPVKDSIRIYAVITKYAMASIISAVIDNLMFIMLSTRFTNVYMMIFASRTVSAIFNFTLNKKMVFKGKGHLLSQSVKYICLLVISAIISAACVTLIHNAIRINIIIAKLLVETVLYFINFYVQKNLIFNKKNKKS